MLSTKDLKVFPFNHLDWLIVNQGEMEQIYESLVGEKLCPSDSPADAIKNAVRLYEQLGKRTNIICTLGGQGVIYLRSPPGVTQGSGQPESCHLPAAKLLNPIKDTTGAGDCFMGTLAAGLARLANEGKRDNQDVSAEEFQLVIKTCLTVSLLSSLGSMGSMPSLFFSALL